MNNYYCFSRNNKYYAIDTVRLIPLKLTESSYEILYKIQNKKGDSNLNEYLKMPGYSDLNLLSQQNILFHSTKFIVKNTFRELNISLIPCLSCNLNCKYCYSTRKNENLTMPIEKIHDTVDFFCKNFDFTYCRVDFVSGGEPLFDSNALINTVNTISNSMKKHNKKTLYWLCTNGLLLNQQILNYLDHQHFNLGISLDGPQSIHDANRIDFNKEGTYNRVVDKISKIQHNTTLSRNIKNLWNCAVVTSQTHSLVDVMKHSQELGFKNLQMKLVWSNKRSIRLSKKDTLVLYEELTQYLYSLIESQKISEFISICNENDTYGKILLRVLLQSGVVRRCNAGVNKFSISPEGKIYPCDSFLGIEEYCLGNVYNGFNNVFYEFRSKRNDNIEKCKECWAKYICGGDCFYHAYLNTGSPWIPDEKVCIVTKEIIKMCVSLIVDLYIAFPSRMEKVYSIITKRTISMEPKDEKK